MKLPQVTFVFFFFNLFYIILLAQDPSLLDVLQSTVGEDEIDWYLHDPSQMVDLDGYLMIASTGKAQEDGYRCGLETWMIPPDENVWDWNWRPMQCLLEQKPSWITTYLPDNDGAMWAPTFGNNSREIYYTVPIFPDGGDDGAWCIGKLTASGEVPNLSWIDSGGPVVCTCGASSVPPGDWACISGSDEPSPVALDPAYAVVNQSVHFLIYGGGPQVVQQIIPSVPDLPSVVADIPPETAPTNPNELGWVEASYIYEHAGWFYLFLNWGDCCRGLDSTYEIHVGRSRDITGPYLDSEGLDLRDGGGDLFIDAEGEILGTSVLHGPGHSSIFSVDQGILLFTFHYYDGNNDGLPWIGAVEVEFQDGWPQPVGSPLGRPLTFNGGEVDDGAQRPTAFAASSW